MIEMHNLQSPHIVRDGADRTFGGDVAGKQKNVDCFSVLATHPRPNTALHFPPRLSDNRNALKTR